MLDWKKQHCGVHRASWEQVKESMPEVYELIQEDFPEDPERFTWDIKVHMLMPNQFPCIPNWHFDNIPRVNNEQDWGQVRTDLPMYLWISGEPLTEFRDGKISPKTWVRFTQKDEHRGTMSEDFQWRGFIRATHKDILAANPSGTDVTRRHSQVYLDASNFSW
ncbi:hypothetical protein RIO-1_25 [Pseudoalteromonas phage RIO-1]|uniref:Uncharacterized protein n=1 Tax=Pseudoalteromonas phage RIO-1 TaxID=1316739 RepID=R4JKH8_9CAUD|nr:hypothetical protein RIO-1_25 [Pseudoalteromonas phage RIO-1]AGK87039.1 hypothetical protein RIO-1_25 [Pseudoalteromonas phage RIO-1]